jgi:tetratricopeptide (TPR) repeat protein
MRESAGVDRSGAKSRSRAIAFGVIAAVSVVGAICCVMKSPHPGRVYARQADTAYADPATCIRCHGDVAATYRETGMGRSFHRVRPTDAAEFKTNATLYNKSSDRQYTMVEKDGKLYEQRHQLDFDGQVTNQEEMQVDYVMGSGNHAKTYLHRTAEGKLIELPVSWYSEMGGYFEMSPGYDNPSQLDFRRSANYECMSCHNAYPVLDKTMLESPDQDIYGAEIPEGVDCQRCHGPGQAHVKLASTEGSSDASIRAAIVNPAKLSRARQMDVCMQCHLETTSSQLPHSIVKFDRAAYSYRPGEPLEDYELFFDHKPGTGEPDRFEIAHEAYRLRKSTCFLKSQMTCLTCHDPHNIPRGEDATQHYIAVCSSCHVKVHAAGVPGMARGGDAGSGKGENCLTCHMWKRRSEDAVHVVMTDHYIQRFKPKRDMLQPFREVIDPPYRDEVMPYYPKSVAQLAEGNLYLGAAQIQDGSNVQAGVAGLRRAIEMSKPKNAQFYFNLGVAYAKVGKNAEAVPWFQEAVRRRVSYPQAERALAAALAASGTLDRAAEVGEKAAGSYPDTTTLTNLGSVYLRLGRLDDAKRVLDRALELNPDLPDAKFFLGLAAMREGDRVSAEKFYRAAIDDQPDFAGPQNNLAGILARQGKVQEAEFHCEKAIEGNPLDAQAYRNYGLLLANTGSLDRAIVELKEAVRLDPKSAQLHVDLGNVFAGQGDQVAAEEQFRKAISEDKENGLANLELAQLLTQQGKVAEARPFYETAEKSADLRVRQAALDALQR